MVRSHSQVAPLNPNNAESKRGSHEHPVALEHGKADHDHGHHDHPDEMGVGTEYQVTWIVAAVVLSLLKYVFCVTGALMIHSVHPLFTPYTCIGVGVQCVSTLLTCVWTSYKSKLGINIAGPDIIAAIFVSNMAGIIGRECAPEIIVSHRMLAGVAAPIEYMPGHEQAMPTLLFMTWLSTFLMAMVWLAIGYTNFTQIVTFLPQSVVSGFLGCVGYKVLKYSAKLATGGYWYTAFSNPWGFISLVLPILPIGIPLFFLKKHHVMSPLILLPGFLLVPVAMFFVATFAMGSSMEEMRTDGWMFQKIEPVPFYDLWLELKLANINWTAVAKCFPDLVILIIILVIDSLLKLAGTKSKIGCDIDMSHEIKICGWQNVPTAFLLGSPGYPQVKFNVLSFGILHNTKDRKVGYFMGVFVGVMWLGSLMLINVLPRLLFGGLLLYACLPFLLENLYEAYFHMTKAEFSVIWLIVLVMAIVSEFTASGLIIAVGLGFTVAAVSFMVDYAHVTIVRDVLKGGEIQSKLVRSYWEEALVARIGVRVRVMRLSGFIFFASASQIMATAMREIENSRARYNSAGRIRHIIIDFEHVSDIDFSGCRALWDVKRVLTNMGLQVYCSSISPKIREKLVTEGILEKQLVLKHKASAAEVEGLLAGEPVSKSIREFEDLDLALEYVEDALLLRSELVRKNWFIFDSFRKLHAQALLKTRFKIFEVALGQDIGSRIWKYAQLEEYKAGTFICREGQLNNKLYLLQNGKITAYTVQNGKVKRINTIMRGAVMNDECLFLDLPVAHSAVAEEDSVVWSITRERLKTMEKADPHLCMALQKHMLRHSSSMRQRLEREINAIKHSANVTNAERAKNLEQLDEQKERANKLRESAVRGMKDALKPVSTKGDLSSKVLAEISQRHAEHVRQVHGAGDVLSHDELLKGTSGLNNKAHQFHHISIATGDKSLAKATVKPHLSTTFLSSAKHSFAMHAMSDATRHLFEEEEKKQLETKAGMMRIGDDMDVVDMDEVEDISIVQPMGNGGGSGGMSPKARARRDRLAKSQTASLSLSAVQKTVMDLGLFPTVSELSRMHDVMDPDMRHHSTQVTLDEFLQMVQALKLMDLNGAQVSRLSELYEEYATGGQLNRSQLKELMAALGHPEDDAELDAVFTEWGKKGDFQRDGGVREKYLTLDGFISMIAMYLKTEELDELVEKDYVKMCGAGSPAPGPKKSRWSVVSKSVAPADLRVNKSTLLAAFKAYAKDKTMSVELAEEMIFDADLDQVDGNISLEELVLCLQMVGSRETYETSLKERRKTLLMRAPTSFQLSSLIKRKLGKRRKNSPDVTPISC